MAVFRKPRRVGKAGDPTKTPTKKQNLASKQKSSIKKTMGLSQQDQEEKSNQQRTKKAQPKKIPDRDRSKVPTLTTTPRVGFMDLSGELRNQIYREVLHFEGEIIISERGRSGDRGVWLDSKPRAKTLSLLQISSQIRKEAISIYYGENTFFYAGEILDRQGHLAKPICMAARFRKWCEDMGAENIKWIKKLEIGLKYCWTCNCPLPPCWPRTIYDMYPYVEFAVKHPNCELKLTELWPPHSRCYTNCGCCSCPWTRTAVDPVLFGERTPIIKESAWVEEIAAGNIVKIQAHIGRDICVDKVIYAREASNHTNREDRWQELCDKLSLNYAFDLIPESVQGGTRFIMQVQKREMPDADMVDSV
ncbi:uncharacterized protein K441DRAFT_209727 [Cenococcum geophilum 1.58]|uniref:uncharacterized protein n=1 Tax=Cenococcum geophilum 1.58 TaxID=794803 RepID=UPI00358FB711|nr:hypothetical protein K441DRAFT_209727 [Cenococcum geophilum 1.58]